MAPSNEVPASSGTMAVTGAETSSWPRPASTPATADVTDLDTDISRCGVSGAIALKYRSVTIRPRCSTRNPSVQVCASRSAIVSSWPARANPYHRVRSLHG